MRRRFLPRPESIGSMTDKAGHVAWATEAVAELQRHCLAEEGGFDFLSEVKRGIVPGVTWVKISK